MIKRNEIIKLAPVVLRNIPKITEGITNSAKEKINLLGDKETAIKARRKAICESCPFNSIHAQTRHGEYEQLIREVEEINGVHIETAIDLSYKTSRVDLHCSLCGCNIDFKTGCISCNCGIDDFNKNNNTQYPLKWEAETI